MTSSTRKPKQVYYVVQEGGSSQELYLHLFNQRRAAERHRRSCAQAAYRTSPVGEGPASVLDALAGLDSPDLWEVLFSLVEAAQEVDYP